MADIAATSNPRADIIALSKERGLRSSSIDWERLLTISYRNYVTPGGVVVDVGAHNGMHARRFRRYLRPSQLVLVEPIPELAAGLRREFRRRDNIEIREIALSTEAGTAKFVVNVASPGESGLRDRHGKADDGHATRDLQVIIEQLDSWTFSAPVSFIKIDVEGGELDVLRGGSELINRDRPIVSIEFSPNTARVYGHTTDDLVDFLDAHNLAILDLLGNELPLDDTDAWAGAYYWDYILMPRERLAATTRLREAVRHAAFHSIDTFNPTVERWKKRLRR